MKLLRLLLKALPKPLRGLITRTYHLTLAYLGAFWYGFPSRRLVVIGVTGTKGKSSTVEMVRAVLAEAGYRTAAAGTIRFMIGEREEPNLFKMTMPGRFFLQRFLRKAVRENATHAVIEMTSEGAAQYRHKGIALNALIFTNISPEHIESHGSFEKYLDAKLSLARHLQRSAKRPRIIVANADDAYGEDFLSCGADSKRPFSEKDVSILEESPAGTSFLYNGQSFKLPLPGRFNVRNALAAIEVASALSIDLSVAARGLSKLTRIAGRAELLQCGQPYSVVIDYAHTPDSLRAIYQAFPTEGGARRICVLGNTGGGRDTWKRPVMGAIAEEYCDITYLTDEDPYDEDPRAIVEAVASGFKAKKPKIVMSRRAAIAAALADAKSGDHVLITGKGTDPYIMRANGEKEPWSDRRVAEEELGKLGYTK